MWWFGILGVQDTTGVFLLRKGSTRPLLCSYLRPSRYPRGKGRVAPAWGPLYLCLAWLVVTTTPRSFVQRAIGAARWRGQSGVGRGLREALGLKRDCGFSGREHDGFFFLCCWYFRIVNGASLLQWPGWRRPWSDGRLSSDVYTSEPWAALGSWVGSWGRLTALL